MNLPLISFRFMKNEHSKIQMEEGLVVIVACSYQGILNMIDEVRTVLPKEPILMVYGGLHMKNENDEDQYKALLDDMFERGVERFVATHCSGSKFVGYAKTYKDIQVYESKVGNVEYVD